MGVALSVSAVSRLNPHADPTMRKLGESGHFFLTTVSSTRDGIHFSVRHGTQTDSTIILTALGVDLEGNKEVLALRACALGAAKMDGVACYKIYATAGQHETRSHGDGWT